MPRVILLSLVACLLLFWGGLEWHHRRDLHGAQQAQADRLAQMLDAFRQSSGRLPCPAADVEGHEACAHDGVFQDGFIPWRTLGLHRASVDGALRLRVARILTAPRALDRLPVDALCHSGLYPDIPLAEEIAAQILPNDNPKPLVTLRRWQLRPRADIATPPHVYATVERREDAIRLRWGTLCGGQWYAQRPAQLALPRPWPGRHAVEWAVSRQGQRGVFWEPGVKHPLFIERVGAQWKGIDALSKEALESVTPRQMAWSGDGRWLATLSDENEARLWDCRALPCARADLGLPEEQFAAAATTRSLSFGAGDLLALSTAQAPYLLLGLKHGDRFDWLPTEVWKLTGPPRTVRTSADGHRAAWESGGHLTTASWPASPEDASFSLAQLPDGTEAWAVSPDGVWVAALTESDLHLFQREGQRWSEQRRQPIKMPEKFLSLQWQDSRRLFLLGLESQISFEIER